MKEFKRYTLEFLVDLGGRMFRRNLMPLIAAACLGMGTSASHAATVDLAFIVDESGSIGQSGYQTAMTALSNALSVIPFDDPETTYTVTVVKFDSSAEAVANTTVIDDGGDIPAIQALMTDFAGVAQYGGGATDLAEAIDLVSSLQSNAGFGDTSLINIATDGVPFTNNCPGITTDELCAIEAAENAIASGFDSISAEAIGAFDTSFLEDIVFPKPGAIISDVNDLPDPLTTGFILTLDDVDAYEAAIGAKLQNIIDNTSPSAIPLPAGLPLVLSGLGVLGIVGYRRKRAA